MCKCKSFSLIELLVVISIIGIITAIAVPAYNQYRAKVLIITALKTAEPLLQDFKKAANTMPLAGGAPGYGLAFGSNSYWPPNQFMVNGTLQNVYTTRAVPWAPISHIGYGTYKSGNSGDGLGGGFTIRIANTSSYLSSTYPYFDVQVAYRWVDGELVMACGSYSDSFGSFPVPPSSILPSNCQCRNTNWWAAVGDTAPGCPPGL